MKKAAFVILAVLIVLSAVGAVYYARSQPKQEDFFAMDTYISVKVKGSDSAKALKKAKEITGNLDTGILSRHSDSSEVSQINKNHGGKMSGLLSEYTAVMLDVFEKSAGKFDFTLGALSDEWNFSGGGTVPGEDELSALTSACGADKITVNGNEITFPEGIVLDYGSVGKGIALDEIKKSLTGLHIKEAVISEGGSILLYGSRNFTVGIQNPNGGGYIAVLNVGECCVSTSGSYERYFEYEGKRYHHILDPDTGYPVNNGLVSVTVISESGILSDALSTACFVSGVEEGMKLARLYGCEAVFVDETNNIYTTENIKENLEITDENYVMK